MRDFRKHPENLEYDPGIGAERQIVICIAPVRFKVKSAQHLIQQPCDNLLNVLCGVVVACMDQYPRLGAPHALATAAPFPSPRYPYDRRLARKVCTRYADVAPNSQRFVHFAQTFRHPALSLPYICLPG